MDLERFGMDPGKLQRDPGKLQGDPEAQDGSPGVPSLLQPIIPAGVNYSPLESSRNPQESPGWDDFGIRSPGVGAGPTQGSNSQIPGLRIPKSQPLDFPWGSFSFGMFCRELPPALPPPPGDFWEFPPQKKRKIQD